MLADDIEEPALFVIVEMSQVIGASGANTRSTACRWTDLGDENRGVNQALADAAQTWLRPLSFASYNASSAA